MSHFTKMAKHPLTGNMEPADWLDGYYGGHRYGVRFRDGEVFPEERINGNTARAEATGRIDVTETARRLTRCD